MYTHIDTHIYISVVYIRRPALPRQLRLRDPAAHPRDEVHGRIGANYKEHAYT